MAYTRTEWKARQGTGLNRFIKTQETADSVNLTNEPFTVTAPGTPFSAENMNHIEQGIEDAHEAIAAESQAREQGDNELAQAIEDSIREHDENEDAHTGIHEAIAAESQARQEADESLQENVSALNTHLQANIQAESQERQNADQTLQGNLNNTNNSLKNLEDSFHTWIGRGGYLEAYNFGTPTPSQNDLTNQALSQIVSVTDPLQVWNGTKIENLFDGHLWALTNTQDTDPPIFEWSDQGPANISPFAQDSGGYIVGADPNADGAGFIQAIPGGKGKVIGWDQIMAASSFLAAHPVGSIYLSADPVNPGIQYGGTWERWGQGRVPVGVDESQAEFNETEKQGGAKTHTLSSNEMPSHTHIQNSHNHTQNAHQHAIPQRPSSSSSPMSNGVGRTGSGGEETYRYTHNTTATNIAATATNQNAGGGGAHNNLQPFITCYMWKRIE